MVDMKTKHVSQLCPVGGFSGTCKGKAAMETDKAGATVGNG